MMNTSCIISLQHLSVYTEGDYAKFEVIMEGHIDRLIKNMHDIMRDTIKSEFKIYPRRIVNTESLFMISLTPEEEQESRTLYDCLYRYMLQYTTMYTNNTPDKAIQVTIDYILINANTVIVTCLRL